jgi:cobalt-zinc-cadmium efflux system protein
MDVDAVVADLRAVDGVRDVHDLHVWVLTSGMNVATAHLVAGHGADATVPVDRVLADARAVLRDRHDVEHATLQVEGTRAPECHSIDW